MLDVSHVLFERQNTLDILNAVCHLCVMCKTEYYGDSTSWMLVMCNMQDRIL